MHENTKELKIGLLAPFSGIYKNLGDSLLLSTQLILNELNNKKIIINPRDSGSNDKEKLNTAIQEIISSGAKIIIGIKVLRILRKLKNIKMAYLFLE